MAANVGRSLETGAILGVLVAVLAATGLLLSPTFMTALGGTAARAGLGNLLYVTHLATAVLLVAFTLWHLVPLGRAIVARTGQTWGQRAVSLSLVLLVALETLTGYELWAHRYVPFGKAEAVLVHLGVTFLLLPPILLHAGHALVVWRARRAARAEALAVAAQKGRAVEAMEARQRASRRLFLRLGAYAALGVGLAAAFGSAARDQVKAWRLNSIGRTPRITKASYALRVTGLVGAPVTLSFQDLLAMPARTQRIVHRCVEGWTYTDEFTGVLLSDVLARAGGVQPGARMLIFKSPETSTSMRTRGQPYTTNFPLKEGVAESVLVTYAVGGEDLPPEHGFPVRLMSPRKWGYKACKWLTEIEVSADAGYQGYWERLGYHNDGDWPGPIFR